MHLLKRHNERAPELIRPQLEVGRFASRRGDTQLEKAMRIAAELDSKNYSGGWVQLLNYGDLTSAPTAVNTFTATTAITSVVPRPFIPANSLNVGTILRVTAWGTYGITATPTTTMSLYLNGASGTQLAITASQSPAANTVGCWFLHGYHTVLTIGSSGTIQSQATVVGINATATTTILMPATQAAAAAINTTNANSIAICATWSGSSSSNTYTVEGFLVEQLN